MVSALLAQVTAQDLESANRAPWWVLTALALLGGTAGIAKLWSLLAEYLRDKRETARRAAEEDRQRRDAKSKVEIEQIEALTSMARAVPGQFAAMGARLDEFAAKLVDSNRILAEHVLSTKLGQDKLREEIHDDTRALVLAIAGKMGLQNAADEPSAASVRRSLPSRPDRDSPAQHA